MKKTACLFLVVLIAGIAGGAEPPTNLYSGREFQYRAGISFTTDEGKLTNTVAYLWIPPTCSRVRGLLLTAQNVAEEALVEHPAIRRACAESDLAIVWFCPAFLNFKEGGARQFTTPQRDGAVLQKALDELAAVSGYEEIAQAPWITLGHSACGYMAQRLADYMPERTIAAVLFKGTFQPDPKNARKIPLAWVKSTFTEWNQNERNLPLRPTEPTGDFDKISKERVVDGWPISLLLEYGSGHFECSDAEAHAIGKYISKAAACRLPEKDGDPLRPVNLNSGWVAGYHRGPLPSSDAPADLKNAPWYFDREMADTAAQLLPADCSRKQQIPALSPPDGKWLPFVRRGIMQWPVVSSENDGVSFSLEPTLLDTLPQGWTNAGAAIEHAASGRFDITRSCGSVEPIGPGRFRVALDRTYPRDNWLVVSHSGDSVFRPSVQPVNFVLKPQQTGMANSIQFEPIADQPAGTVEVPLKAVSTSGLKVDFFVRSGPAVVRNDRLIFTSIPPRSAYPINVTVVAWQWGRTTEPTVQTAPPGECTFRILKP